MRTGAASHQGLDAAILDNFFLPAPVDDGHAAAVQLPSWPWAPRGLPRRWDAAWSTGAFTPVLTLGLGCSNICTAACNFSCASGALSMHLRFAAGSFTVPARISKKSASSSGNCAAAGSEDNGVFLSQRIGKTSSRNGARQRSARVQTRNFFDAGEFHLFQSCHHAL